LPNGIAATDRLHDVGVLIWDFPKKFLPDHLFDLFLGDESTLLVAIQNHPNPIRSYVLPGEVIGLTDYVSQSRHFRHRDDVNLIAIADQMEILIIQSRRQVDQNEIVAKPQEIEGLVEGSGADVARRLTSLRSGNQVQTARVV